MASIADKNYAGLAASIKDWAERPDETDELVASYIALATAEFNLIVRDRRQETTTTLTTVSGSVALPADFLEMISVRHATYGNIKQTTRQGFTNYDPYSDNGVPASYLVEGSTFYVDGPVSDDFSVVYRAKIPDLDSVTTTTNWLLTLAPQAYLFESVAMLRARYEDFAGAQGFEAKTRDVLDRVGVQSMVSQFGNAPIVMRGARP